MKTLNHLPPFKSRGQLSQAMSQIVNLKKIVFWFFFKLPTFFLSVWKHLIISHLMKPEDNYHKRCHGRDHHNDTLDGTADVTILVLVTWARKLVHVILPLTHWVSSFERRFGKPLQVAIYIFKLPQNCGDVTFVYELL